MKKKMLITVFALITAMALCACGDKNTVSASSDDKTASVAEKTDPAKTDSASEASVSEPEPEPEPEPEAAPVIPEGYEEVEVISEYYGVKVSFAGLNDGRFVDKDVELNESNLKNGSTDWEVKYVSDAEFRNGDFLKYSFMIAPDDGSRLKRDMDNGIVIEDHEGTAYFVDEPADNKCKIAFVTDENTFFDGRIKVEAEIVAYADFMSPEDFKAAYETFLDTVKITVLDTNGLNGADGSFPSYSGVYTVPAKLTIAGNELENHWTVESRRARAEVSFTDENGEYIAIREEGKNVSKYVGSRNDDPDRYRPVTFGDYSGICEMNTSYGNIIGEYTIVFEKDGDDETNMTFRVIMGEKGEMSSQQLRDIFSDEAQVSEIQKQLDAYAEEYLSQIVYNGTGE